MSRLLSNIAVAVLGLALAGCAGFSPVKDRLDVVEHKSACADADKTLLVLLPGRFDAPQDFVEHGFVEAVRRRKLNADIAIPDLHLGYYLQRSAVDRLRDDILLPAKAAGYRRIWLAGVSLGGLGSLLYLQLHAEPVDGAILIAPYLGRDPVIDDIAGAGGLAAWNPGALDEDDYERQLWRWLRTYGEGRPASGARPDLYVGYGAEDRFARSNALLAAMLPKNN